MHLINVHTLQRETFLDDPPRYITLSHRWRKNEIIYEAFEDYSDDLLKQPSKYDLVQHAGFYKIANACRLIREQQQLHFKADYALPGQQHDFKADYLWCDTCCIDKRSAMELSQAINRMFEYYENSYCCFTFLDDVEGSSDESFSRSEWFDRGWTLQELIAPQTVFFFDRTWQPIGDRSSQAAAISLRTGIEQHFLNSYLRYGEGACVAQKMSWLSGRRTTLPEDMAYCMLGLFGMNIDLRYGEGHKAFRRLQQELLNLNDESLFAWQLPRAFNSPGWDSWRRFGLLAPWPTCFEDSGNIWLTRVPNFTDAMPRVLGNGISIRVHTHSADPRHSFDKVVKSSGEAPVIAVSLACTKQEKGSNGSSPFVIELGHDRSGAWQRSKLSTNVVWREPVFHLQPSVAGQIGNSLHIPDSRYSSGMDWDRVLADFSKSLKKS